MQIPPEYLHHRIDRGMKRLLCLSRDVATVPETPGARRHRADAAPEFERLYRAYLGDMRPIAIEAQHWWQRIVDNTASIHGSFEEGKRVALVVRASGMSANENYVSCIREHWFAFTRLNLTLPLEQRVPPEDALLLWPLEDEIEDIYQVVISMLYWPIGIDAKGNWC